VRIVGTVQAHERLPLMDSLARIDPALDDFARDTKAEITLHASGYDASERSLARLGGLHRGDLCKRGCNSGVLRGLRRRAGREVHYPRPEASSEDECSDSKHRRTPKSRDLTDELRGVARMRLAQQNVPHRRLRVAIGDRAFHWRGFGRTSRHYRAFARLSAGGGP